MIEDISALRVYGVASTSTAAVLSKKSRTILVNSIASEGGLFMLAIWVLIVSLVGSLALLATLGLVFRRERIKRLRVSAHVLKLFGIEVDLETEARRNVQMWVQK